MNDDSTVPITRFPIDVDTRGPGGTTNAYLVDGLLVDPAARVPEIDTTDVDAVAVTHTHPDHVGGVADYATDADATVYAHADHADRFREATGVDPDKTVSDGERVGDRNVSVLETPGHATDHVAFAVGESGARTDRDALVGDLAVAEGSVVVGGTDGDLRAYLDSLERVRDAGFRRLYPGHGPAIEDPVTTCQRLIDHRLDREASVLAAVEDGAETVDDVVDAAYEKDLTGVEDLARVTVMAHLEKLVADGRIDGTWADRRRSDGP